MTDLIGMIVIIALVGGKSIEGRLEKVNNNSISIKKVKTCMIGIDTKTGERATEDTPPFQVYIIEEYDGLDTEDTVILNDKIISIKARPENVQKLFKKRSREKIK
jgi:hypothetical protein